MSLSFNNALINFPFQKQMKYDLRKSRNTLLNINADIKKKKKERYFQLCNLTFYSYFGPTVHAFMETIQIMTLEK